jgi:hypothetical protein
LREQFNDRLALIRWKLDSGYPPKILRMIEEMERVAQRPHITPEQYVELVSIDCDRLPMGVMKAQFQAQLDVLFKQRDTYELDEVILNSIEREHSDPYLEVGSDRLTEIAYLLSHCLTHDQLRTEFSAQLARCIQRRDAAFPPETIEFIHEMERKGRSGSNITPTDLFNLRSIVIEEEDDE